MHKHYSLNGNMCFMSQKSVNGYLEFTPISDNRHANRHIMAQVVVESNHLLELVRELNEPTVHPHALTKQLVLGNFII